MVYALCVETETARLRIRPVRPSDREALARFWSSPRVTQHLGGAREKAAVKRALRQYADPNAVYDLWTVEERDLGRVIGQCGLLCRRLEDEDVVEIIYVFGSRYWGRGYATEAVASVLEYAWMTGLKRVFAFITRENVGSQRVAAKLGFVHERTVPNPEGKLQQVWVLERPRRRRRSEG